MKKISLAISPCPNDVYIYAGLITGAVKSPLFEIGIDFLDIEQLNQCALAGTKQVIKMSAAALNGLGEPYRLLPCGGALGRGCGPMVLSHGVRGMDSKTPILIPGENTTAHVLYNFYVNSLVSREAHFNQRKKPKEFLAYDQLYTRLCKEVGCQGVVIHESRFSYKKDGLTLIQDLGAYWEEKTGHPIPLGVVVCRDEGNLVKEMTRLIRQSLNWAKENSEEALKLCERYAQELSREVITAHIELYVNDFSDDMGEEGREAIHFLHHGKLNKSLDV